MTNSNIEIDQTAKDAAQSVLQYIVDTHPTQAFKISKGMLNSISDLLIYRQSLPVHQARQMLNYLVAQPQFNFETFQTAKKRGHVAIKTDTEDNYQYFYHLVEHQYVNTWNNQELVQLVDQLMALKV